jgi:hypothetical protein
VSTATSFKGSITIIMLCDICQTIPVGLFYGERDQLVADYFELPLSIDALRESARAGNCDLCSLISDHLHLRRDGSYREPDSWSTCSNYDSLPADGHIRVSISGPTLEFIGVKDGIARRGTLVWDVDGKNISF